VLNFHKTKSIQEITLQKITHLICIICLLITSFSAISATPTDYDEKWHHMGEVSKYGYEWLYFDLTSDDGLQLSVAFLGPNGFDPRLTRSYLLHPKNPRPSDFVGSIAQGMLPSGKIFSIQDYGVDRKSVQFDIKNYALTMENSSVARSIDANGVKTYQLTLNQTDSVSGQNFKANIEIVGIEKSWMHKKGYLYVNKNNPKEYHKWVVSVPRGKVTGDYQLTALDGTIIKKGVINGLGYHDHNYGTVPMGSTIKSWYWGRSFTKNTTVIAAKVFNKKGAIKKAEKIVENIAYMSVGGKRILGTITGIEPTISGRKDMVKAANKMKYPKEFKFAITLADGSKSIIEMSNKKATHEQKDAPGYVRVEGDILVTHMLKGNVLDFSEKGHSLFEVMNLRKAGIYQLKKAIFDRDVLKH
jgi:hypothetical protein